VSSLMQQVDDRGLVVWYDPEHVDRSVAAALTLPETTVAAIPSTTLLTKNGIFISVPGQLVPEFRISEGAKKFCVRFDIVVASTVSETT
jgi:hypothetical protein